MIAFFNQKMNEAIGDHLNVIEPAKFTQSLPLIIKRYDFPDTLSAFIHLSNHKFYDIQGPHVNKQYSIILN